MSKETAETLRKAKALLIEKGWQQHAAGTGPYCSSGAISAAIDESGGDRDACAKHVNACYALASAASISNIVAWNDAPDRTKDQVLAAFTKAIKAEESSP